MASKCLEEDEIDLFSRPFCLIDSDESGKFVVREPVLEALGRLDDGETVVVSVVGRYRSGKSYLMNRLCGRITGFPLGSTVQAKTKGIWVWVRVHPVHPEKYLVLLDTEGLGDAEKGSQSHDDAICILATLLSSILVFNNIGTIDYNSLTKLHFVSMLAKHLYSRGQINKDKDGNDEEEKEEEEEEEEAEEDEDSSRNNLNFKFPDFIYVVRDFDLDLEIEGQKITPDRYLDNSLSVKPTSGSKATRAIRDCNRIKLCLRRLFPNRKCFTFVRPVSPEKMKYLDQMADEDLLPEFIDNTGSFVHHVWENGRAKIIDGRPLTGKELSLLIKQFVDQVNCGGLLRITDVVDVIRSTANEEALNAALNEYVNQMVKTLSLPIPTDILSNIHSVCLNDALKLFHSKAVFLNDDDSSFQTSLTKEISQKFAEFAYTNEDERMKLCRDVLEQSFDEKISHNINDGLYSRRGGYLQFRNDMDDIERDYYEMFGSVAAKDVLLRFREKHFPKESIFRNAEIQADLEEEMARVENLKSLAAERQKEAAEREIRFKTQLMAQNESLHEQIVHQLNHHAENQKRQMQLNYEELMRQKLSEQERLLSEGFNREANQLKVQIDDLKRRL